jgi:hypothetical protein
MDTADAVPITQFKPKAAQEEADRVWMAECDNIRNTINRLIEEL